MDFTDKLALSSGRHKPEHTNVMQIPPRHDPRACIERRIRSLREHAADARRGLLGRDNPPAVTAARIVTQASADVLQANWLQYELDAWTEGAACPLSMSSGQCRGCGT